MKATAGKRLQKDQMFCFILQSVVSGSSWEMGRILAIGDIHGCRQSLESLATHVGFNSDDSIVCLGDYIDRGPNSRGVIDFLIELESSVKQLVNLKGNHEVMMLESREDSDHHRRWLSVGGVDTLASYRARTFDQIPQTHWDFLENLEEYCESENHIFVHANLEASVELEDQTDSSLYWKKLQMPSKLFKKGNPLHCSGKMMVCGHTPQKSGVPLKLEHAICIDTHVYEDGGWLTCLDVETEGYWQANEKGELNIGSL